MGTQENVCATFLKGEKCNLTEIHGVSVLKSKSGVDLINISEGLHLQLVQFTKILGELSERISALESRRTADTSAEVRDLRERLNKLELEERQGPEGPAGRDGAQGPRGERGPKGFVEKLSDIKDVNIDGIEDGCILIRRGAMWVVEKTEE